MLGPTSIPNVSFSSRVDACEERRRAPVITKFPSWCIFSSDIREGGNVGANLLRRVVVDAVRRRLRRRRSDPEWVDT